MIKQSKTTIKELTAQYRAVLKRAFLAGVAAVAVSTTGARALSRFDADAVKGSDVTTTAANEYFYTAGGIDTIFGTINAEKPDGTDFGFKNPDGTDVTLDANGATTLTADSYAKASAAETSDVVTWAGGTTVKYDSDIKQADYSFKTQTFTVDGSGNVTFGGDGKAITEAGTDGVLSAGTPADVVAKYTFSNRNTGFTGQQTITSSTAIDATKYQQNVGTSVVLHLNDDGTKILDAEGHDVSLVPDYQTAFTELKTAYDTDKKHLSAIQTALTTVNQYNSDNYAAAGDVYDADTELQGNLSTWKGQFAQATSNFEAAADAYDASLGKAIDDRILDEDGAVAKAVTGLISDKEAKLSEQLGYNIANNPANDTDKAPNSLVNSLTMNEGKETAEKVTSVVGAINANTDAIAQVRSDAKDAWDKGEAWISQELGYDTKTTDAKTELAEAGFKSTDFLGAVTENKEAIAQVRSDAKDAWDKGEAWISQELGYDTKTTDAKTELAEAGFKSTDFLGAVTENKEAIAQVRSDAKDAWDKGEAWISQELGYDTKTTDAKTELAEAGFKSTDFLGAVTENKEAIAQVRSDAKDAWDKGEAWISQELGYDTKTTDAKTELAEAGFKSTDFLGAVTENKEAIAQVRSDAKDAWDKGEAWISQELGYDTKTTDAKTELAEAGFKSTDFLGAVTENKEAIAQVRSDAKDAWDKGEAWISQELGYDTKTTDAKTELAKAGFEATDFLGALQELDQTDLALSGKIADEATRAMEEEAAIRSEFAAADALTLSSAKAFANAGDELTLSKANAYTDAKVDTLEKNVSGGIAAATALSAVEVSNVKRGEMSVGGGYGYYNGQSAGAFGMAMGLSDNWSVNAGAGIASGDKTQVSFRAGTNYKFKLF